MNATPLRQLDYPALQQCMHCGLCLPVCPTYDATKLERHSPRGRIALMRAIADGKLSCSTTFGQEMSFCLGCLACTSVCPAGVNYASLFEHSRAQVEASGALRKPGRTAIRAVLLHWLFMEPARLDLAGRALRLYQQLGLQTALRRTGLVRLLPSRWRQMESSTPTVEPSFSADLIPGVTPARGRRRYRVALLTGCVQDLLYSQVNRDTAEVLARNGCEVFTPRDQPCCGSLHSHNGEVELARQLARRQFELVPPENFDAIISNAGGCGAHLKHYSRLLADDPRLAARARLWDARVQDIHEWLVQIGLDRPAGSCPAQAVTYHESCHLAHGQGVLSQPRQVLRAIPNLRLVELPESNWCCGSAGVYSLTQPAMAGRLLDRKLDRIRSTGCNTVATANPGCLLQLLNGARQAGMDIRIAHPVSLLAEAYRHEEGPGSGEASGSAQS